MRKGKIVFLLIILFIFIVRQFAGQFLIVNQPPQNADAIIVLSCAPVEELKLRLEHACFLYQVHYAPWLILSGESVICKIMRDDALKEGIPLKDIITEDKSFSTYENALNTKAVMISHGFKSAIVVSSEYHMRRTQILFNKLYKGTGIQLTYSAAEIPYYNPSCWWGNKQSTEATFTEYCKLFANILGIYSKDNDDKNLLNYLNNFLFH